MNREATQGNRGAQPIHCPWCLVETNLTLQGNGMGGIAVRCGTCGAQGPMVEIDSGFNDGDREAIAKWYARSAQPVSLDAELVDRIVRSVNLQQMIAAAPLALNSAVPVQLQDLEALLRAFGITL